MDKKGFLKACVMAIAVFFVAGNVMAQTISQVKLTNDLSVPLDAAGNIISANNIAPIGALPEVATALVDNFECWGNAWNWAPLPYRCFYHVNNVLDFEQGSRVMDVYLLYPSWLPCYDVLQISKKCAIATNDKDNPTRSIPGENSLMSVEVRAPLAIEQFDQFSIIVKVTATSSDGIADQGVKIVFRPMEGPMGATGVYNRLAEDDAIDEDDPAKNTIKVALRRIFQEGSWHFIEEDLADIVAAFDNGDPDDDSDDAVLQSIEEIMITGNTYRLDNIMFVRPEESVIENHAPHIFPIGTLYVQLYGQLVPQGLGLPDPTVRWVYAEDGDLGITAEYGENGQIVIPMLADSVDGKSYDSDLAVLNPSLFGEDDLDIFELDPNGHPDTTSVLPKEELTWIFTIGDWLGPVITDGFIERASLSSGIPFSADDMNSWPPHLMQENGVMIVNMLEDDPSVVEKTGTIYKIGVENPMYALACALYNRGYDVFPNAVKIVANLGQVFEDMIVTCRVSDGVITDKETFPVLVVNYPVSNNPPIIENCEDQIFEVGKTNYYQIVALDPDFEDMAEGMTYSTISRWSPSDYMPFCYPPKVPIDPKTGLITYVPQKEPAFECIVSVKDPRGMYAKCTFTITSKIFDKYPGNWFNHPPIIIREFDSPQTIRAGERFIANNLKFFDPDGDKMYWSCNVGSVGSNGVYSFQSMYPGDYFIQITVYDIRGGMATTEFVIQVKPWWSL